MSKLTDCAGSGEQAVRASHGMTCPSCWRPGVSLGLPAGPWRAEVVLPPHSPNPAQVSIPDAR